MRVHMYIHTCVCIYVCSMYIVWNVCVYASICIEINVTTIKEQEAMKLKKSSSRGYIRKFRGRKRGEKMILLY